MPSSLRTRKVIHPFEFARGGFLAGSTLLSVLVWISAAALRIPSKFHLVGLFLRSSAWALGSSAHGGLPQILYLSFVAAFGLISVVTILLRNWIFLGEGLSHVVIISKKDGFD